jgi:hypothetical protein
VYNEPADMGLAAMHSLSLGLITKVQAVDAFLLGASQNDATIGDDEEEAA